MPDMRMPAMQDLRKRNKKRRMFGLQSTLCQMHLQEIGPEKKSYGNDNKKASWGRLLH